MIWGVRILQEAHGFDYGEAVHSLGNGSVRLDHRLPAARLRLGPDRPAQAGHHRGRVVLLACLAWILYGRADVFPPYVLGLVAGMASGAAMLPYTVIKEANPPEMSGTATGVVNFLNFTFSALLGPVFGWILLTRRGGAAQMALEHYQTAFSRSRTASALAIILTLLLKETGPAARPLRRQSDGNAMNENWNRKIRTAAGAVRKPSADSDRGRASVRERRWPARSRPAKGIDRSDPRRSGREDRRDRESARHRLGRPRSLTHPTAMPPPQRRWSWFARAGRAPDEG